jgi:hypothetical protein
MQEGRAQEVAYIAKITNVQIDAGELKVFVIPFPQNNALVNDALWRLRVVLDIAEFEFSRNHWAVKDRDLFEVLGNAGFLFEGIHVARFENRPLPAPTRQALFRARDVISEWSHTEIDDLLLEAGVTGLEASRAIGSRRDRANAIIEYVLSNPVATTVENSMLSAFIVRKTSASGGESKDPASALSGDEGTDMPTSAIQKGEPDVRVPNRVFVVHGQNESARTAVVSVLKRVGLEPIVLHEQPSMGRHLLTKFIDEAELVTFAVVLMTDDDLGGTKGGGSAPRARQNVILELGYFLSHLGQPRVCALITPGLETPSDFDGIVYIRMDPARNWEAELLRELKAAGVPLVE